MTDAPISRQISIEEFLPLLGARFSVDSEPRAVDLELLEVTPLQNHARLDRPPFILIFRSEPDALLSTGVYTMRSKGFGPDLIYIDQIVAPAASAPGYYYQAIFN